MIIRKKRKAPEYNQDKVLKNPYFDNPDNRPQKKPKKGEFWVYFAIIVVVIISVLLILFRSNHYQISNITITNTQNISTQQIEDIVNEYLNSNKLVIFKKGNFYLCSEDKLGERIENELSQVISIKELSIQKIKPNKLNIEIKERIPNMVWVTNETNYFMDLDGVISSRAESIDEEQKLPKIFDQNNLSVEINKQVVSTELVDYIIMITEELPNLMKVSDFEIDSFYIPELKCQKRSIQATEATAEDFGEDTELDQQKRDIQEKFKNNEISIDESLALLESLRKEYLKQNNVSDQDLVKIAYEEIFEDFPCDYIKTIKDIEVKTTEGWKIYLSTYLDFTTQVDNLNLVLKEKLTNRENLEYIDVRFIDRVYYK